MRANSRNLFLPTTLLFGSLLSSCSTIEMKPEGRAASDQLLTAISVQDALQQLDLSAYVKDRRVFFAVTGHSSEIPYIEKIVPAYLMDQGAVITAKSEDADMILTFVIDTAGSDKLRGGVSIPIILPSLTAGIAVTTINIIEREEQLGMCRLWVYATKPGQSHAFTTNPAYAEHSIKNLRIFGVSLGRKSDINELNEEMPVIGQIPVH